MRKLLPPGLIAVALLFWPATTTHPTKATGVSANSAETPRGSLWPNSLCAKTEQIIFSCVVRRAQTRAATDKIASLCASPKLTKEEGYLQYRFGLPRKVELEFPSSRTGTQQMFQYTHYMRFQVDLTEINFTIDGYQYQIFDTYNGEEKPAISEEGVNVMMPDGNRNATFNCRTKAKADYSMLDDVLKTGE